MARFDERSARCSVFVYREGALSAVGHDLRLDVSRFVLDVDLEARTCSAVFDARSITAVRAMSSDSALGDGDRRTIEGHVQATLETGRFPNVELTSIAASVAEGGYAVEAALTLHGVEKRIALAARWEAEGLRVRVRLNQPDFGIKPFSAMFGALRIKPGVDVEVSIPKVG